MQPEPPALPAHKVKRVQPEHKVKQERKVRQAHKVKLD